MELWCGRSFVRDKCKRETFELFLPRTKYLPPLTSSIIIRGILLRRTYSQNSSEMSCIDCQSVWFMLCGTRHHCERANFYVGSILDQVNIYLSTEWVFNQKKKPPFWDWRFLLWSDPLKLFAKFFRGNTTDLAGKKSKPL